MKRALFLDRDGVINIDKKYVYKKEDIEFIDGIFELVRYANKMKYLVIVVTNQAGIGRGLYSEEEFLDLTAWMKRKFFFQEAKIDQFYFSPFHPIYGRGKYKKDSELRKPNPGMFFKAKKDYIIDLENSIMIGDRDTDIIAAQRANIKNIICIGENCKCANSIRITKLINAKKYFKKYL